MIEINVNKILNIESDDIFLETDYYDLYKAKGINLYTKSRFIQVCSCDGMKDMVVDRLTYHQDGGEIQFYIVVQDMENNNIKVKVNVDFKGWIEVADFFELVFEIV